MGSFYVNITANTAAKEAVNFLKSKGSSVYVMPTDEHQCVIYEEKCDTQDIDYMYELLQALTAEQNCTALGVLNHDDDMLYLTLWNNGEHKAELTVGYDIEEMDMNYELDEEGVPIGWHEETEEEKTIKKQRQQQQAEKMSQALATSFNMLNNQADILKALSEDFVFVSELHEQLFNVLGLPEQSVGLGYNYIASMQPEEKLHYGLDLMQLMEIEKADE